MRISGISQRTPTMVYDLRPMHLYILIFLNYIYLAILVKKTFVKFIYSEYDILTIDKKFDPFLFAKKDFHTNS